MALSSLCSILEAMALRTPLHGAWPLLAHSSLPAARLPLQVRQAADRRHSPAFCKKPNAFMRKSIATLSHSNNHLSMLFRLSHSISVPAAAVAESHSSGALPLLGLRSDASVSCVTHGEICISKLSSCGQARCF